MEGGGGVSWGQFPRGTRTHKFLVCSCDSAYVIVLSENATAIVMPLGNLVFHVGISFSLAHTDENIILSILVTK